LDEVAASARTMELAEQVAAEVWTKVEYVLNHHKHTLVTNFPPPCIYAFTTF
jgi:hypothetical protein